MTRNIALAFLRIMLLGLTGTHVIHARQEHPRTPAGQMAEGARRLSFLQSLRASNESIDFSWSAERHAPEYISGDTHLGDLVAVDHRVIVSKSFSLISVYSQALGICMPDLHLSNKDKPVRVITDGRAPRILAVHFDHRPAGFRAFELDSVTVWYSLAEGRFVIVNSTIPDISTPLDIQFSDPALAISAAEAAYIGSANGIPKHAYLLFDMPVWFPIPISGRTPQILPSLTYVVRVEGDAYQDPQCYAFAADATLNLQCLYSWSPVCNAAQQQFSGPAPAPSLSGTVNGYAQPGLLPDSPTNPNALLSVPDAKLVSNGITKYSNAQSAFAFSLAGPVTITLDGRYSRVVDGSTSPSNLTITGTLSPGPNNNFTFNLSPQAEHSSSQINAHLSVQRFRQWVKGIDDAEGILDFPIVSRVNYAFGISCQARFEGTEIQFSPSAANLCVNSAYSTVVWHEEGHWANELYGYSVITGSPGYREGAADIWALYIGNTPLIGQDTFAPGEHIRSGWNTRRFCGDENLDCYVSGDPLGHFDGEVLMGMAWKFHELCKASPEGKEVAERIWLAFNQLYDTAHIRNIIGTQWKAIDSAMYPGTSHASLITSAMTAQGFPTIRQDRTIAAPLDIDTSTGTGADFFSSNVAVADVNADGLPDTIVAARQYDDIPMQKGKVWVFSGEDGSEIYPADSVTPSVWAGIGPSPTGGAHLEFVAAAGDLNADGFQDVAFGSITRFRMLSGFDGSQFAEVDMVPLLPQNTQVVDLSSAGDFDGDGQDEVMVSNGLSVWVFNRDGSLFVELNGGGFIAGDGDINNDGRDDIVTMGGSPSAVRVISGATQSVLYAVGIGHTLARVDLDIVGDVNADGCADIIIGEGEADVNGADSGLVRLISGATGMQLFQWTGNAGEKLGEQVSRVGDYDKDGYDDVAAGSNQSNYVRVLSTQTGAVVRHISGLGTSLFLDIEGALGLLAVTIPDLGPFEPGQAAGGVKTFTTGNPYELTAANLSSSGYVVGLQPVLWATQNPVPGGIVLFHLLGGPNTAGQLDVSGVTQPMATDANGFAFEVFALPSDPPGTPKIARWTAGSVVSNDVLFRLQ